MGNTEALVGSIGASIAAARPAGLVVSRDLRSIRLEQRLRETWSDDIRKLPPARRERWLESQEGIVALGARAMRDLLKDIRKQRNRMRRRVCGDAWLEAWDHRNDPALGRGALSFPPVQPERPPIPGKGERPIDTTHDRRYRRFAVRMVLSRAETRYGIEGDTPTRRWTPPQAVGLEDLIDELSPHEAFIHSLNWERSCSADVIGRIAAVGGTPIDGNW